LKQLALGREAEETVERFKNIKERPTIEIDEIGKAASSRRRKGGEGKNIRRLDYTAVEIYSALKNNSDDHCRPSLDFPQYARSGSCLPPPCLKSRKD